MIEVVSHRLYVVMPPCRSRLDWLEAIKIKAGQKGWLIEEDSISSSMTAGSENLVSFHESLEAAISTGASLGDIVVLLGDPELHESDAAFGNVADVSRWYWSAMQAQDVLKLNLPREAGRILQIATGLEVACPPMRTVSGPRSQAFSEAISLYQGRPEATWRPELFNYDVKSVDLAQSGQAFDITGKPRFLVSGPYITMPKGFWQATIKLGFDDGASRTRFRIDWGEVESYQSQEFCPGQPGFYEIIMSHNWPEPAPAEVRLVQLEGVFDGHVTFSGAEIMAGDPRLKSSQT